MKLLDSSKIYVCRSNRDYNGFHKRVYEVYHDGGGWRVKMQDGTHSIPTGASCINDPHLWTILYTVPRCYREPKWWKHGSLALGQLNENLVYKVKRVGNDTTHLVRGAVYEAQYHHASPEGAYPSSRGWLICRNDGGYSETSESALLDPSRWGIMEYMPAQKTDEAINDKPEEANDMSNIDVTADGSLNVKETTLVNGQDVDNISASSLERNLIKEVNSLRVYETETKGVESKYIKQRVETMQKNIATLTALLDAKVKE